MRLTFVVLALLLAGCSQAVDGFGLVTGSIPPTSGNPGPDGKVSGNLYRVMANDRTFKDRIEKENYTLLRAAETAKAAGGTHFVLVSAGDQSSPTMPTLQSVVKGGEEFGAYVRVLKVDPTATAPIGSIAVDEIIHFFGPQFGRSSG